LRRALTATRAKVCGRVVSATPPVLVAGMPPPLYDHVAISPTAHGVPTAAGHIPLAELVGTTTPVGPERRG
jgi:hypothetical protein